jgi:hypothetical protein
MVTQSSLMNSRKQTNPRAKNQLPEITGKGRNSKNQKADSLF